MASLKDIKKRIKSVKNTQKITKAMKMVSAAKLRKAQEAVETTRPYVSRIHETVSALATRLEKQGEAPHPLLEPGLKGGPIHVIVLTSDRGLCGGFNAQTVKRTIKFLNDEQGQHEKITISTIGRKGRDALKNRPEFTEHHEGYLEKVAFFKGEELGKEFARRYTEEGLDGVFVIYNHFKSGITLKQLLPIECPEDTDDLVEHEYVPTKREILDTLIPKHFAIQMFQTLQETIAAEHLARMMAMDSATTNANDMVQKLQLKYNRARQAAITTELMEIISGAEALK